MKLTSNLVLNSANRNSSVDVFRGIAIILVVLYHFNNAVSYGYVGVDLFFVISGLLIGGLLTKKIKNNEKINLPKFILERGFKIWPSYFAFLFIGIPLSSIIYSKTNPTLVFDVSELPKYTFFYENYFLYPGQLLFDQVWSLCVEEHFYIILPILLITITKYFHARKTVLLLSVFSLIILGVLFKYWGHHATSFGTHARIDALAWGVLLSLIIAYYPLKLKKQYLIFIVGIVLLFALIFFQYYHNTFFYERVIYHSALPFAFFLMILGLYNYDLSSMKIFRYAGYYSYNWYLWHQMFHLLIVYYCGSNFYALICFVIITFLVAIFFTIIIEETVLSYRPQIINRLFKKSIVLKEI